MSFGNVSGLPNRGKTLLSGPNRTPDATSTTSRGSAGTIKVFKNLDYSGTGGVFAPRAGGDQVTCILVRNSSGITILPKRLVTWKAGKEGYEIDGYARLDWGNNLAGIVDEFLPATGVVDDDYFWLVVKGPVMATTSSVGDATNVIGVGDPLVSLTAATSQGSSTAGRLQVAAPGGTTNITNAYSQILNVFATALSAKTTTNTAGTSANVLIDINLL